MGELSVLTWANLQALAREKGVTSYAVKSPSCFYFLHEAHIHTKTREQAAYLQVVPKAPSVLNLRDRAREIEDPVKRGKSRVTDNGGHSVLAKPSLLLRSVNATEPK